MSFGLENMRFGPFKVDLNGHIKLSIIIIIVGVIDLVVYIYIYVGSGA